MEIVVAMAIISIITSAALGGINMFYKFKNEIDAKYFNGEILSFIEEARHICMLNKKGGEIMFDEGMNKGGFYEETRLKDSLYIPAGFKLYENTVVTGNHLIDVNSDGTIDTPCTLAYIDREKELHYITICVGTAYAEIKN